MVGLFTSGSHRDFNDHLVHAVDEYRQNKQRIQEQSKEVQRKLYQLQLEDLTRKERDKKRQAGVLEPAAVNLQAAQQGALQNQYPRLAFSLPVQQPQSQLSPTPTVTHVHIHNYGNPTNKNRQNQGPRGQFRNNQQQGSQGQRRGPLICYGCNMEGHIRRNCLANPYPPQQGQGNSFQGRQEQGGSYQAGPFVGQGY